MSEDDLLDAIIGAAVLLNWRVHHDRRSDKALQQGHAGFPDLVLGRRGHVLFIEAKSHRGRLTLDQQMWLDALPSAMVVRPDGLDALLALLR